MEKALIRVNSQESKIKTTMTLTQFTKKTLIVISLLVGLLLLGFAATIFMMFFASVVVAVLLSSISNKLSNTFPISYPISLLITCVLIILVLGGAVFLIAPSLNDQIAQLQSDLPIAIDKLRQQLSTTSWGKEVLDGISEPKEIIENNREKSVSGTTGIFSSTFGILVNAFFVFITALFLAANPKLYINGFLKLFLPVTALRLREVFYESYYTLGSWLKGKFLSMLVVGILTYVGLLLLDFPIPIVLSLISMALTFIPNLGPALAMVPAVLLGFMEGPERAFHVLILYIAIQLLETYLITPFIDQKAVSLPPALTLFWQILLGMFLGGMGLILATPLLAVILVFINELYIKDYIKKRNTLKNE